MRCPIEEMSKRINELEAEAALMRAALERCRKAERSDYFRGDFHKRAMDTLIEKLLEKNPDKRSTVLRLKSHCYTETKKFFREFHGKI